MEECVVLKDRGSSCARAGMREEALAVWNRALNLIHEMRRDGEDDGLSSLASTINCNMSFVLLQEGRHDEAADSARAAIADQSSAKAHYRLSSALRAAGDLDGALDAMQQALEMDASNSAIADSISELQQEKSLAVRRIVLEAEALKSSGNEFFAKNQYAAAIDAWTAAVELIVLHDDALVKLAGTLHSNISASLLASGDARSALRSARKAAVCRPDWAKAGFRVGKSLSHLHRWEAAVVAFENAFELDPSSGAIRVGLEQARMDAFYEPLLQLGKWELKVMCEAGGGQRLVATKAYATDEVIVEEVPLVVAFERDMSRPRCGWCIVSLLDAEKLAEVEGDDELAEVVRRMPQPGARRPARPFPCRNACEGTLYCSKDCEEMAWSNSHAGLCPALYPRMSVLDGAHPEYAYYGRYFSIIAKVIARVILYSEQQCVDPWSAYQRSFGRYRTGRASSTTFLPRLGTQANKAYASKLLESFSARLRAGFDGAPRTDLVEVLLEKSHFDVLVGMVVANVDVDIPIASPLGEYSRWATQFNNDVTHISMDISVSEDVRFSKMLAAADGNAMAVRTLLRIGYKEDSGIRSIEHTEELLSRYVEHDCGGVLALHVIVACANHSLSPTAVKRTWHEPKKGLVCHWRAATSIAIGDEVLVDTSAAQPG